MRIKALKLSGKTIRHEDTGYFCEQVSFMLEAGISVLQAVDIVAKQAFAHSIKIALLDISDRLSKGYSLSSAMDGCRIFQPFMINMIEVGETMGRLDIVFSQLAAYYKKKASNRRELSAALLYPFIVVIMMLAVSIIALVYILPNFTSIYASMDASLPWMTRLMINASVFLRDNLLLISVAPLLLACMTGFYLRTPRGKYVYSWLLLYLPVVKTIYRTLSGLNFAKSVSLLLDAGIPLYQAMEKTKGVMDNIILDRWIDNMMTGLVNGKSLSAMIREKNYFDSLLCDMIKIGEETGRLPKLMNSSAEYAQSRVDNSIKRINKLVEPILMIILGIVLGFVLMAILLPVFDLAYYI